MNLSICNRIYKATYIWYQAVKALADNAEHQHRHMFKVCTPPPEQPSGHPHPLMYLATSDEAASMGKILEISPKTVSVWLENHGTYPPFYIDGLLHKCPVNGLTHSPMSFDDSYQRKQTSMGMEWFSSCLNKYGYIYIYITIYICVYTYVYIHIYIYM